MSFKLETVIESEFVRITPVGNYGVEDMSNFIDNVRIAADEAGCHRVLMDCRRFKGRMTEADRFEGGQHIARAFGSRVKAALIMPSNQITRLGQLAAVNRGARFFVTDSETEATAWLSAP